MWIFGGQSRVEVLSDLWQYDIQQNNWTLLFSNYMYILLIFHIFCYLTLVIALFTQILLDLEVPIILPGKECTVVCHICMANFTFSGAYVRITDPLAYELYIILNLFLNAEYSQINKNDVWEFDLGTKSWFWLAGFALLKSPSILN